jgi:hypothetical protein
MRRSNERSALRQCENSHGTSNVSGSQSPGITLTKKYQNGSR